MFICGAGVDERLARDGPGVALLRGGENATRFSETPSGPGSTRLAAVGSCLTIESFFFFLCLLFLLSFPLGDALRPLLKFSDPL